MTSLATHLLKAPKTNDVINSSMRLAIRIKSEHAIGRTGGTMTSLALKAPKTNDVINSSMRLAIRIKSEDAIGQTMTSLTRYVLKAPKTNDVTRNQSASVAAGEMEDGVCC